MIQPPNFQPLLRFGNRTASWLRFQRKIILISAAITTCVLSAGIWSLKLRSDLLAQMKARLAANTKAFAAPTPVYRFPDPTPATPSAETDDVLGITDTTGYGSPQSYGSYVPPTPLPTLVSLALPTSAPQTSSTTTTSNNTGSPSTPDCGGVPTAYNSEAMVSSATSAVNVPVSIEIQLLDCHNQYAPVNDTLVISQSTTDATARINGVAGPVTIQAQNGKASFTVNSQSTVTDTFVVRNTTRSFNVTDPHNRNPSVTFSSNTSGNPNCTTVTNVPNAWYSAVYPNPPISTTTGSVTLIVEIRDCNQNLAPVTDTLTVSLQSGDPNTKAGGHILPYSLQTSGGKVSFSVSSSVTGQVTLKIHDDTSNFDVTDSSDHNPTVTFGAAPTPVPTQGATPTPTTAASTPAPTSAPTAAPTAGPSATPAPTATPGTTP